MRRVIKRSLVAGLIMGVFSLSAFAQTKKPTASPATTKAKITATEMAMAAGQLVYEQNCLACHQVDGGGVPHLNPPLIQTDYVLGEKARIIGVVLNGLDTHEPINDEVYSNVMPTHDFLTDRQIADVLTFVRNSFGNEASAISVEAVKAERSRKK